MLLLSCCRRRGGVRFFASSTSPTSRLGAGGASSILIFLKKGGKGGDKLKNLEKKLWGSLRPVANIVGVGAEVLGLPGSHFLTLLLETANTLELTSAEGHG